jgi:CHAD domain-containing protein
MRSDVTSFSVADDQRSIAVDCLTEIGFAFAPPRAVTRSLLDTFDGRLYGAGLRLELAGRDPLQLILSGENTVTAHLPVSSVPRFAGDLPAGPFRSRIAALTDVRALLQRVRLAARQSGGALHDGSGKTVVVANLFERLSIDDNGLVEGSSTTIEIVEVTGYAKRARAAIEALDRLGLQRLDDDTLATVAANAGIDLAGYSGSPTVPLDPAMPATDGCRLVLANLADAMQANWQGTIDEVDPEFLHDFRVAVRRTRSVLTQGKQVMPSAVVNRAGSRFAWLGTLTGPARDLDVYLIEWKNYTESMDAAVIEALEPVHAIVAQRCRSAHSALAQWLRSVEAAELMAMWQTWLRRTVDEAPDDGAADELLGKFVSGRIRKAHARLVEHGRLIDESSPPEQVHDLRKDAKKLRYLLECFASLLPDAPRKSFVRRLKALQDNLGEYQDSEVHGDQLADIAARLLERGASSDTMLATGRLAERFAQRCAAARIELAERFAEFDSKATRQTLKAALEPLQR